MNRCALIGILLFAPSLGSAYDPRASVSMYLRALSVAGFAGAADLEIPPPPQSPAQRWAQSSTEQTREALEGLVAASLKRKIDVRGELLRKLGLGVEGDRYPASRILNQYEPDVTRTFRTFVFGDDRYMLIEDVWHREKVRSFLLDSKGLLISTAVTTPGEAGGLETNAVPKETLRTPFDELLKWWVQYYLDNLKTHRG